MLVAEDGSLVRVVAAPQAVLRITPCPQHGTPHFHDRLEARARDNLRRVTEA